MSWFTKRVINVFVLGFVNMELQHLAAISTNWMDKLIHLESFHFSDKWNDEKVNVYIHTLSYLTGFCVIRRREICRKSLNL